MVSNSNPEGVEKSTPKSYTEIIYENLPFYMAIGMTADEYLNGDCTLTKYYRKAYEMQRKLKNQELWLQGMYIYEAILDVAPILHPFAKKGTKPLEYSKEPYPITAEDVQERHERENQVKLQKALAKVSAWAAATNKNIAQKGVNNDAEC